MMHIHIGCICLTFLHCAFSNVASNYLHEKRHSHIVCICLTFLHCVFSNVSSKCLPEKRHSCIDCICVTFLHCGFSNVPSNCLHEKMHSHNERENPQLHFEIYHLGSSPSNVLLCWSLVFCVNFRSRDTWSDLWVHVSWKLPKVRKAAKPCQKLSGILGLKPISWCGKNYEWSTI